jgi:hypothetical protein
MIAGSDTMSDARAKRIAFLNKYQITCCGRVTSARRSHWGEQPEI